jgi:hypothetical protein
VGLDAGVRMTTDTERILLNAVEGLRGDVGALTKEVAAMRERAAREDGLGSGLALARRVEHVEAELAERPTTAQIGAMFDDRLRKLTIQLIAAAIAGIPVWMGAGVALAALLSH